MGYRLIVETSPLAKEVEADLAETVTSSIREAAEAMKTDMRRATGHAFKSKKLPLAWRSKVYPNRENSVDATAWVHMNSASAAKVIEPALEATVIRGRGGKWLAIPLAAAGKDGKGRGIDGRFRSRRMTPEAFERATGQKLRFYEEPGGNRAFLIADGYSGRPGSRARGRSGAVKSVVVFLLVKRVLTRKRLDLDEILNAGASKASAQIVSRWG